MPFRRSISASTRRALACLLGMAAAVSACNCENQFAATEGGLVVKPTSINFGAVAVGTVQEQIVQVTNIGRGEVIVSSIQLQTANVNLAIVNVLTTNCDGSSRSSASHLTLLSGGCAEFAVRYGPTGETPMSDTVLLASNAAETPLIKIPIKGSGVAGQIQACQMTPGMDGAAATVDTASCIPGAMPVPALAFGAWPTGQSSTRTVRVFNLGMYDLAVNDAHVEGETADFAVVGGNDFSQVIHPGDTADLLVQFTPATNGDETANLLIPSSDPVNPTLTIPITGETLGPALCIMPPPPMAFGTINVGTSRTLTVTLTNCGEADYDLTQLELVNNQSDAVFVSPAAGQSGAIPTIPATFPAGATLTLSVTFTPVAQVAYSGYFSVVTGTDSTTYQRAVIPITGTGGFPGCDAAGGQDLSPTANIAVEVGASVINPATYVFSPLTQVTLDGTGSTAPAGSTISSYQWRIVSQPAGGTSTLTNPTKSKAGIYVELVGQYVIELVVSTDVSGQSCQSAPVEVTLNVASTTGVHIQLTWPQTYGDVDLHYIGPDGSFYETSPNEGDLDWEYSWATAVGPGTPSPNCGGILGSCADLNPDWGKNDTVAPDGILTNNASLDVDQRWGSGPENVTHLEPFDGTYTVAVHYFCSYANETPIGSSYGNITGQIKIWNNGVLIWSGQQTGIGQSQVWDAAEVVVSGGGATVTVNPLSTPLSTVSEGCTGDD